MSRYKKVVPSGQTLRLLRPSVTDPITGALASPHTLDDDGLRRLDQQLAPYTKEEVRNAIAMWHSLPPNMSIVLDLKRVYPWLAKYWRDVWDLYALGYRMVEIANYYRAIRPGTFTFTVRPDRGNRIVHQLVDEVLALLPLHEEYLKVGQVITAKGFKSETD